MRRSVLPSSWVWTDEHETTSWRTCVQSDKFDHESRVQFLNTVAILLGCFEEIGGELPDGRRPDVLRLDPGRNVLLVADAKHSESPGCTATQHRLSGYITWMATHVHRRKGIAIFAICFGTRQHALGWLNIVPLLSRRRHLHVDDGGLKHFAVDLHIAWFVARSAHTAIRPTFMTPISELIPRQRPQDRQHLQHWEIGIQGTHGDVGHDRRATPWQPFGPSAFAFGLGS